MCVYLRFSSQMRKHNCANLRILLNVQASFIWYVDNACYQRQRKSRTHTCIHKHASCFRIALSKRKSFFGSKTKGHMMHLLCSSWMIHVFYIHQTSLESHFGYMVCFGYNLWFEYCTPSSEDLLCVACQLMFNSRD